MIRQNRCPNRRQSTVKGARPDETVSVPGGDTPAGLRMLYRKVGICQLSRPGLGVLLERYQGGGGGRHRRAGKGIRPPKPDGDIAIRTPLAAGGPLPR